MVDWALKLTEVGFRYDDGPMVIENLDLRLAAEEIVAIVGPSGCGKSTLLRIAAGLNSPTQGTALSSSTNLGFVFQDPALLPWRTVRGNVGLMCDIDRVPAPERDRQVDSVLDLVGLSDAAELLPHQLSGGMQMRTSLARALTLTPDLFLMDEPFASLDELIRERLNGELLDIHAQQRFAALIVTHSITEAAWLAQRVLVMSPSPARISASFDMPFPYPREPELRYEADFAALCGQISQAMR